MTSNPDGHIDFGELFAFTAIDIFSKEVDILLASALTAEYGCKFLSRSMQRRFNGHTPLFCNHYRVARPYRKNEQSYIESFNQTVRKESLVSHLINKLNNYREICAINADDDHPDLPLSCSMTY